MVILLVALRVVTELWPIPPFFAHLVVDSANVRARPDARAPAIGLLRAGDTVRVIGCVPGCETPGAWAVLDGDGAVRLAFLRLTVPDATSPPDGYAYGRVIGARARVRVAPDPTARVREVRPAGQDLAFVSAPVQLARGWLVRPDGGFVQAREIRLATASPFRGEGHPSLPLALFVRSSEGYPRYHRAPIIGEQEGRVELADGAVPRRAVRIARLRRPPEALPAGARWVHVSLREQVLVAYEGTAPVFATLVSTGRAEHPTPRGLFRVWHKERHVPMHAGPPEPYFVDEVPFVQYFRQGVALHGTFWHDRFGRAASHGCVNLSMADAEWLFDWAPPPLPYGWHAIEPEAGQRETVWVLIER
jgi:lipoprotein-anchoring transpeptidase ErfK/SrfK